MIINVGTRGSKLALAQTNAVIKKLKERYPEHNYHVVVIRTTGDRNQNKPLDAIGSRGIFIDEIEKALLAGNIQMAVHSMKDMPSEPAKGLVFADAWKREDPRDVLILRNPGTLQDLKKGANIATGSKRRAYQLLQLRPDINICPIRGNIDSRIRKLKEGLADGTQLDGIVLAAAGLKRLGLDDNITEYLDVHSVIPAPAQGTLAIELRDSSRELIEMVNSLSDKETGDLIYLERGFLKKIGGDCHLPVGAYAEKTQQGYRLLALFGDETGEKLARAEVSGTEATEALIDSAVSEIRKLME